MGAIAPIAAPIISSVLQSAMQNRSAPPDPAQGQRQEQIAEINRRRVTQEREKKEDLRRKQAQMRARYGASGLLNSGSADAVLNTLRKETEQSIANTNASDQYRISGLAQKDEPSTGDVARSALTRTAAREGGNLLAGWIFR